MVTSRTKSAALLAALALLQGAPAFGAGQLRSPLGDVLSHYGFSQPVRDGSNLTTHSRYASILLEPNVRKFLFDGVAVLLNEPITETGGNWTLADVDVKTVVEPLLRPGRTLSALKIDRVVLDPGHGGTDSGALGRRGVAESEIVLDIARRAQRKLEASGIQALLTRSHDTDLDLRERSTIAGRCKADLMVSIHANCSKNAEAAGVETYVLPVAGSPATATERLDDRAYAGNAHDAANTALAYYIHKGVLACTREPDRGVRRARFAVLRDAPCPAVLVECGFVSNPAESRRMATREFRDAIAEGIARGILTTVSRSEAAP